MSCSVWLTELNVWIRNSTMRNLYVYAVLCFWIGIGMTCDLYDDHLSYFAPRHQLICCDCAYDVHVTCPGVMTWAIGCLAGGCCYRSDRRRPAIDSFSDCACCPYSCSFVFDPWTDPCPWIDPYDPYYHLCAGGGDLCDYLCDCLSPSLSPCCFSFSPPPFSYAVLPTPFRVAAAALPSLFPALLESFAAHLEYAQRLLAALRSLRAVCPKGGRRFAAGRHQQSGRPRKRHTLPWPFVGPRILPSANLQAIEC